jgi:hypothetical protein
MGELTAAIAACADSSGKDKIVTYGGEWLKRTFG